jgi:hypothetical protein
LREYVRELVVAKRRRVRDADRDIALAWHTAVLTRTKEIPKLTSLLSSNSGGEKRQQSPREQVLMWQTIAAYFGGTFQPVKADA